MGEGSREIPNGVREERGQSSAHGGAAALNWCPQKGLALGGCRARVTVGNADLSVKVTVKERETRGETEQCRAGLRNQMNESSPP